MIALRMLSMLLGAVWISSIAPARADPPQSRTGLRDEIDDEHERMTPACGAEEALDRQTSCRDQVKQLLTRLKALNGSSRSDDVLRARLHYSLAVYEDRRSLLLVEEKDKKDKAKAKQAAIDSYDTCATILKGQNKSAPLPLDLSNLISEAEKRKTELTHVDIRLTSIPPGARVFLDGLRKADAVDGKVAWINLEPGSHAVRIEHPEFVTYEEVFTLEGGEKKKEKEVTLKRKGTARRWGRSRSRPCSSWRSSRWPWLKPTRWQSTAAWSALGVAVVGVGVGIGCQVAADSNEAIIDAARDASGYVDPNRLDPARAQRLRSDADTLRTVRTVGFVVGGMAAAAALTFFLWPDEPSSAAVAPVPGGAVVQWQGAF